MLTIARLVGRGGQLVIQGAVVESVVAHIDAVSLVRRGFKRRGGGYVHGRVQLGQLEAWKNRLLVEIRFRLLARRRLNIWRRTVEYPELKSDYQRHVYR